MTTMAAFAARKTHSRISTGASLDILLAQSRSAKESTRKLLHFQPSSGTRLLQKQARMSSKQYHNKVG